MDDEGAPASAAAVPRVLLTIDEAARALALSARTVQILTAEGRIACVRIGKVVRYRLAALEAFAAASEAFGEPRSPLAAPRYPAPVALPPGAKGPGRPRDSARRARAR